MRKIFSLLVILFVVILPLTVHAATNGITLPTGTGLPSSGVTTVLDNVSKFVISLIAGLAVLMIVASGIMYITAGGDSSKAEKAKEWLIASIVGLVIALLAFVIVIVVGTTLGVSW